MRPELKISMQTKRIVRNMAGDTDSQNSKSESEKIEQVVDGNSDDDLATKGNFFTAV
jgi:hypothetical protein